MNFVLMILIFSQCILSFDLDIIAMKRNVRVEILVIDDLQNGRLIGCKYQNICSIERTCYNDELFGICLKNEDQRIPVPVLPQRALLLLGRAMQDLWKRRFKWSDFYAQCLLQSIIRITELQARYDVSHCHPDFRGFDKREINEEGRQMEGTTMEGEEGRLDGGQDGRSARKVRREIRSVIGPMNEMAEGGWLQIEFDHSIATGDEGELLKAISNSLSIQKKIKINTIISGDRRTLYYQLPALENVPPSNFTTIFNNNKHAVHGFKIVNAEYRSNISGKSLEFYVADLVVPVMCSFVFLSLLFVIIYHWVRKIRYKRAKLIIEINRHNEESLESYYRDILRLSSLESPTSLERESDPLNQTHKQSNGEIPTTSDPGTPQSSTTSSSKDISTLTNMDIYTGHMVLAYVENNLNNRGILQTEWNSIQAYKTKNNNTDEAKKNENIRKNRSQYKIPYDKSRVVLTNFNNEDYINASIIFDSDPKLPQYIAAQSPLVDTLADFWQMIWEQGVVIIVNVSEQDEIGAVRYWPEEDTQVFGIYEVNLVSEHFYNGDFVVRNLHLKNLKNMETKTVKQFHFLKWPLDKTPLRCQSVLKLRRKVNKSYRLKSAPILVHCSDGCGRSGSYILLDIIIKRVETLERGLKKMDVKATLEHLRDQRMDLVNNEEQFRFVMQSISEEVDNALNKVHQ